MERGSNRPFSNLRKLVEEGKLGLREKHDSDLLKETNPTSRALSSGKEQSEEELFLAAMKNVTPLGWSRSSSVQPPPPIGIENVKDTEDEALRLLEAFVHEQEDLDFDPAVTGESIEKHVQPIGLWLLNDLRKGRFSIQTQLDLHGLRLREARQAVEKFIVESVTANIGCVRIIHGRGWHSKRSPVLKDQIQNWLSSRRMSRYIVAFTSARLCDGGAGALYVLLRRPG